MYCTFILFKILAIKLNKAITEHYLIFVAWINGLVQIFDKTLTSHEISIDVFRFVLKLLIKISIEIG